jgi:hypothetical protein
MVVVDEPRCYRYHQQAAFAKNKKRLIILWSKGSVYVSCVFGIVQFNLETLPFGDTYFIGDNGAEIIVIIAVFMQLQIGIRRASTIIILMIWRNGRTSCYRLD